MSRIQAWTTTLVTICLIVIVCQPLIADGPNQTLVYYNQEGNYENIFVLSPSGQVSGARYRLGGQTEPTQFDRLTFIKSVEFRDGRDNSPLIVRGWMYKGTDKTSNTWRIIFSKDQNQVPGTYAIYYAFGENPNFTRWNDARREVANFSHRAHAVLWANQVDSDRLGLQAFRATELDPLAPSLAWESVLPELNRLLKTTYGRDCWANVSLIRLPDSRLRYRLSAVENCKQALFGALKYRDDLNFRIEKKTRSITIQMGDISRERFFTGSSVDLHKVAHGIAEVIQSDPGLLSQLGLSAAQRIGNRECTVYTRPWKELRCGQGYCQYWRLNYGFEIIREAGVERYKLSTVLDIGERRASEPATEKYIVHKYTSKNASSFDNFQVATNQISTKSEDLSVIVGDAGGAVVVKAIDSSSLRDVLNDGFQNYQKKITGN